MRQLQPGQICRIWTAGPGEPPVARFATSRLRLESPNWLSGGDDLVLNGGGRLWRLSPATGRLDEVPFTGLPPVNNDHLPDPDGKHIYLSAYDRKIYRAPVEGGAAELITDDPAAEVLHFLHGVHPSGDRLAFIGLPPGQRPGEGHGDVFTVSARGRDYRRLTCGPGHSDGCEYSPDGEWLYFNTEMFDGHAQIARIRPDGSGLEQLTFDDEVNWFPHLSPDGRWATYIAFPAGTRGHPPNVRIDVRIVALDDWSAARTVATVAGGQGSLDTNSWSADSSAFAFVSYPAAPPE
ncbi:hypothetical protein GCM10010172_34580 [Paractinoplanes ferrugineus]|uniref:Biopolymer transporter Tol n=1 Tax=Paractinoplanes ferrugineus TaxID=113564 RepID=A0A919MHZ5_9ACTN|nr:PD40 domain-containing protein [Actinoplanes ferrugineus]GIE15469.1 hypothetical protein Afe05nite_73090 [Actinoplanes ferrugineus]